MVHYNYYKLLGVPVNAAPSEIKNAYRKKAKTCHPDVADSSRAKEVFQLLNKAYSTLMDENARRRYNLQLTYQIILSQKTQARKKGREDLKRRMAYVRWRKAQQKDVSPQFKLIVYSLGIVSGTTLGIGTITGLFMNTIPYYGVIILFPAMVMTLQGWSGFREHRTNALAPFYKKLKKLFHQKVE